MSKPTFLDYDFVYESHKTDGFSNVRIKLTVAGSHLEVVIESEHLPDIKELSEILNAVRRDHLQKLKLDIWGDFKITLKTEGVNYNVLTDSQTGEAVSLEQI